MSLERLFHWTCDFCKKAVQKRDYGLPPGWAFVKQIGGPVPHACEQCKDNLPPGTRVGE